MACDIFRSFDLAEYEVGQIVAIAPAVHVSRVCFGSFSGIDVVGVAAGCLRVFARVENLPAVLAGIPAGEAEPDLELPLFLNKLVASFHELHADGRDRSGHVWRQPILSRNV